MKEELKAKVNKYLGRAKGRFESLHLIEGPVDLEKAKKEFFEMAQGYYSDANHFYEKEDYVNALAALEYAEGWLDAGRALGIFDIKNAAPKDGVLLSKSK